MAADYSFHEFQENQRRTLDQAVRAPPGLSGGPGGQPALQRRHALEEDHGPGIFI